MPFSFPIKPLIWLPEPNVSPGVKSDEVISRVPSTYIVDVAVLWWYVTAIWCQLLSETSIKPIRSIVFPFAVEDHLIFPSVVDNEK